MSRRLRVLLAAVLLAAGCTEFDDPTIPERSAPAVLQANMRVFDQGVFQVDGSLMPGRDSLGFQRPVQSPFILAGSLLVEPKTLGERGLRTYSTAVTVPRGETLGPFVLVPPNVRDVGELPTVRWYGLARVGPDTLVVGPREDIVLRMDTAAARSEPPNINRQWFLDINAGGNIFRLSGTGTPPLNLRIPFEWIPERRTDRALISLIYFQSAQLRSADNLFIGSIVLDVRLSWVVRFTSGP